MDQMTSQLGHLLVQSLPTVVLVLFLVAILNRLFFKPLTQTLEARAKATSGALADARQQAEAADERLREYERAIQAARQEIYQHREAVRRVALSERDDKIQQARSQADAMVKEAQASLEKEAALAKLELRTAVESLAVEVMDSLFAPRLPGSGQGGAQA